VVEFATHIATPLISIGMPTYNRPQFLRRAIEDARSQTYPNLEIIIADNSSPDPEVEMICRSAERQDARVRYFRQNSNIGPTANFEFVLARSSGEFFVWFADDDLHTPSYIDTLLRALLKAAPLTVLACLEAQYESEDELFPFFPEGEAFYCGLNGTTADRISTTVRRGPGNIIYGLFRRSALFHDGVPITRWVGKTLNELPLFALVAFAGSILCLPEIGLRKRAPPGVFRGARWEQTGGFNPNGPALNVPGLVKYHWTVLKELYRVYDEINLSETDRRFLKQNAMRDLATHAIACAVGWKPARRPPAA
jgi:glycosyltransferase involved in cell wall biosynthesis